MKFFYLAIIILILMLVCVTGCTQNGSEIGLVRNWGIYDLKSGSASVGGVYGNLILNCDNTYTFNFEIGVENPGVNEIKHRYETSGTYIANSTSKRLHLNCNDYTYKIDGVEQPSEDSDGNAHGYYILQCYDLTFITEVNGYRFTFLMTPE